MSSVESSALTRMLRLPEVEKITGYSGVTIARKINEGTFPKSRKLGARAIAWREDELRAWMDALPVTPKGVFYCGKTGAFTPPAGWKQHPKNPVYYYKGQEVITKDQLEARVESEAEPELVT